jgi:hypothetical protein
MMKTGYLCKIVPLISGLIVLAEGLYIFSIAGDATIDGIGFIEKSTIQLWGLLLLVFGLMILLFSVFKLFDRSSDGKMVLLRKISSVVIISLGFILASEGATIAYLGGRIIIQGYGAIEVFLFAAFSAQLFFLGTMVMLPALLGSKRIGLTKLLMYIGGALISTSGIYIVGRTADVIVEGFGRIDAQSIGLIGSQLFLLGVAFILFNLFLDMTSKLRIPLSILRYIALFIVTVEGLLLISLAAPIEIPGMGTVVARTIILAGFCLTLIGLFTLFLTGLRDQKLPLKLRRMTFTSVLLLTLLLPIAAFTVGNVF